ncbi:MAG: hypothetical protein R8P61_21030 [Bacteroidia bacterium]|nr:hypothetical protein [Bacteroidia bacterium]
MRRSPFISGFFIGLILIFLFVILLLIQGKLVWKESDEPMQMPRKELQQSEQTVDSLKHKQEVLDTLPEGIETD